MSNVESSKNLAGIGSLLLILSIVPYAGAVLGIIGLILFLVGVKGLANYYQDNEIYQASLMGVIFYIIALIAVAVAIGSLVIGFVSIIGIGFGIIAFILALIVAFIFYVLAAVRIRRAFSALGQKSGEHMFETAGLLLFIGAILTIFLVGLVLILVAWILATIAFFSMKLPQQQQPYSYTPPTTSVPSTATPTSTQPTRYCPNCGAPVQINTTFCPNCGKQLPQ
jgi:uncharacterized membrane protein